MSGFFRVFVAALPALLILPGCPGPQITDPDNPAGVVLERRADDALPGGPVDVTITITAADAGNISAIGVTESIPEGWIFDSATGSGSQMPTIVPANGATGDLGFLWIVVPPIPCTFTYRLIAPEDAVLPAEIRGRVHYYEDGGLLGSEEVTTTIENGNNPAGVRVSRAVGDVVPGQNLEVTITLSAVDGSAITALGLTEVIPEGWTLVSVSDDGGANPAVRPDPGAVSPLDFVWISVPDLPGSFSYTLAVPLDAVLPAEIRGQANY